MTIAGMKTGELSAIRDSRLIDELKSIKRSLFMIDLSDKEHKLHKIVLAVAFS